MCKIFWLLAASWNTITVTAENNQIVSGHKNTKKLPINLHIFVSGTISQKPTVVIVTNPHQRDIGIEVNNVASTDLSTKYTQTDPINNIIENNNVTAAYSSLYSHIALINHLVRGIFFNNLITLNTLKILKTFQNSHTAKNHKKNGKNEIKSIILPNEKINNILFCAFINL